MHRGQDEGETAPFTNVENPLVATGRDFLASTEEVQQPACHTKHNSAEGQPNMLQSNEHQCNECVSVTRWDQARSGHISNVISASENWKHAFPSTFGGWKHSGALRMSKTHIISPRCYTIHQIQRP